MQRKIYVQGDILLQPVDGNVEGWSTAPTDADGKIVLQHGERSGHRHVVDGPAQLLEGVRPAGVPSELYVGHLVVSGDAATLSHEEHASITLPKGTYVVRRQREFTPHTSRNERLALD